jgi:8-oxo-dGTP pyrophosphatase MutT (NUDIX family)
MEIYTGRIIRVAIERVTLPDGREFDLEMVRHPGGAAVVALDGEGRVCLLHQYRHAADGWLWELPAGKREAGEAPLQTAQRELQEEAGCTAAEWLSLGAIRSSPGVFDEVVHLFLARNLRPAAVARDAEEVMEVTWLPIAEALRQAAEGTVSDAKSVAGLFRAAARLGMLPPVEGG